MNPLRRIDMHSVAVFVLFLTLLVGKTTLSQVSKEYSGLGWIGEPRILLVGLLVVLTLPFVGKRTPGPQSGSAGARQWIVLVLLFHAYIALTYLWSPQTENSTETLLSLGLLFVLFVTSYILVRFDPEKTIRLFMYLFAISALIYALTGLWNLLFSSSFTRLRFLWGGPNVYVRIVGAGAIAIMYLWIKTGRKAWLLCIPLLLLASLMSGSRGGVTSLVFAILLSLVFTVTDVRKLIALGLIALVIIGLLFTPLASRFTDYIKGRYLVSLEKLNADYERGRGDIFSRSWKVFSSSPLLGGGIGSIPFNTKWTYSHNIVLEVAADGGLVGLCLLLLLLVPVVMRLFKPRSIDTNFCLVLAMFFLLSNLLSGSYYDWRYMWILFLFYMMPAYGLEQAGAEPMPGAPEIEPEQRAVPA